MLSIEAQIVLLPAEEGGLEQPVFSGVQPSMAIRGDLVACKILDGPEGTEIGKGVEHDVRIDLAYGEVYSDTLRSGFRFDLNVGRRVIGRGVIL